MDMPTKEPVMLYSESGQQILEFAKEEALSFNHHYIGVEHVLLGILREGSAADLLSEQDTTLERVRAGLLFFVGRDQGDPKAGTPFTPETEQMLAQANKEAQAHGETAISSHRILEALQSTAHRQGIILILLPSLGTSKQVVKEQPVSQSENERALRSMERMIEQYPSLSPEEELHLIHLVTRGEREKKNGERLKEDSAHLLVEEGETAYFRLVKASQHLVLTIAKEYIDPQRDLGELINTGNIGLTFAIHQFGMKTHVPFRSYAAHWIHIQIIDFLSTLNPSALEF